MDLASVADYLPIGIDLLRIKLKQHPIEGMSEIAPSPEQEKRHAGRPRAFDRAEALEAAMRVFWQHGYDGASLTELTEAMGISRPSLYAAFGDKAELFRETLTCYSSGPAN